MVTHVEHIVREAPVLVGAIVCRADPPTWAAAPRSAFITSLHITLHTLLDGRSLASRSSRLAVGCAAASAARHTDIARSNRARMSITAVSLHVTLVSATRLAKRL